MFESVKGNKQQEMIFPSKDAKRIIEYLDCPCETFEPTKDKQMLYEAYSSTRKQGELEGFVPVIVVVSDHADNLLEMMYSNVSVEYEAEHSIITPEFREKINIYRQNLIQTADAAKGKEFLDECLKEHQKFMDENSFESDDSFYTQPEGIEQQTNRVFAGWDSYISNLSHEIIIAKIPVIKPWEVIAWIPFGNWNECPSPENMINIVKHWYEKYGAVPALISSDILEMQVDSIINEKMADELALEQLMFCSDIVYQGCGTVENLAYILSKVNTWYFWWD